MRYFSSRGKADSRDFAGAALTGLAPDGGLYVPEEIPPYPRAVLSSLGSMSFLEIALETIKPYVYPEIPQGVLEEMIQSAFSFPAPLIPVGDYLVLELFHGPTAAFKDFGARFMARAFSYLRRNEDKPLRILVATSGDTGGAVADGFFGVPGIDVTVLYPKGRVSPLQEKQIAGLGGNINALAVEGSFDDCQALVKAAFQDEALRSRLNLSSANSINIARLIPQSVYYAAGSARVLSGNLDGDEQATPRLPGRNNGSYRPKPGVPVTCCVPSGNFGNLTAGLYAMKMGAPIAGFIAATNANRTVPDYLSSGNYEPRASQATLSNAMDVGAPSNFERLSCHWTYGELRNMLLGVSATDEETRLTIKYVYDRYGYFLDPHTAVGWHGIDTLSKSKAPMSPNIALLATAHPAKFSEAIEDLTGSAPVPASLSQAMSRKTQAKTSPADISAIKDLL